MFKLLEELFWIVLAFVILAEGDETDFPTVLVLFADSWLYEDLRVEVAAEYVLADCCFFMGWCSLFETGEYWTFELLWEWPSFIGADCVDEVW